MKRRLKCVSNFYKTEYKSRLKKKIKMHAKRNTESVSECYETESVICFACILIFFVKQLLYSVW